MDARTEAKEQSTAQRAPQAPPCTMVIFGAGGDLTKRLLMPALYNLAKDKLLSDNFAIIAADRTPKPAEAFRDYLAEGVKSFVSDTGSSTESEPFDAKTWEFIAARITHFAGDFTAPETYTQLDKLLEDTEAKNKTGGNVLFYLAVAEQLFGTIVERIGAAGLAKEKDGSWRRVIIEKPFGRDLATARALNARILKVLDEPQIFRMDHFLGKETVQNIMALRFSNAIFEPLWNRDHIDHVQITAAETVGVERRANFYEVTGALRDMVPNHVFQLLSLTAMESPNSFAADAVRNEKTKILEAIQPLDDEAVRRNVVRGQYAAGAINGAAVQGYRQEPGVNPNSMTETYVALRLGIESWRWAGVPFYLRTGKALAARRTEIAIKFKEAPLTLFRSTPVEHLAQNFIVLRIQPDEGIALQFNVKVPGPQVLLEGVRMDFKYKDYFDAAPTTGYETLIYDCMIGDGTLFQQADEVEAAWRVVQPILDDWHDAPARDLNLYPAGSEGPSEADDLLARDGRQWRMIAPRRSS